MKTLVQEVSINAVPFEDGVFQLGIKEVEQGLNGETCTSVFTLSAVQVARLAIEAHTVEMSMRGVMRPKQRFSRARKWLLERI